MTIELSAVEQKKMWEGLLVHPAWLQLIQVLQEQTDVIQNEILFAPVTSAEDVYRQERKKGQLEGRLSITNTAQTILAMLEQDIAHDTENSKGDN